MSRQDFNQDRLDEIEKEIQRWDEDVAEIDERVKRYIASKRESDVKAGEAQIEGDDDEYERLTKSARYFSSLILEHKGRQYGIEEKIRVLKEERREITNQQQSVTPEKKLPLWARWVAWAVIIVGGVSGIYSGYVQMNSSQQVQDADQAEPMYGE